MNTQQNLSLYHIGNEFQNLFNLLYDYETGEINMDIQAQIDALEITAEKKCEAVVSYIKNMEADKQKILFLKDELARRERAFDIQIDKMENYLINNMERCNIQKIQCPLFTIKLKKNPYSTDITDKDQIPEKFMRKREVIKVECNPDKNAIKEEVLKTGVQVPGAYVIQKTKLEILTDKI